MRKYFVRVKTKDGPRFVSGFQQVGVKLRPILSGFGSALFLKHSTAEYLRRKLSDDGFAAFVEEVR